MKVFTYDNIEQFKELMERYRTISMNEIRTKLVKHPYPEAKKLLTGFGHWKTCKLCIGANDNCKRCIWNVGAAGDIFCADHSSYFAIKQASTPLFLLRAYRYRYAIMKKRFKEIKK